MELVTYLKIVLRYWWLVLLVALAATGVALALSLTRAPSYTTHARVVAHPSSSVQDSRIQIDTIGQLAVRQVMGTFAQLFTSADVRDAARITDEEAAAYPLEANVLPDTSVIEVTARGRDPKTLAAYVNATVAAAVANGKTIYTVIELQPLEQAAIPQTPVSPQPTRDIPLGAGLGLVLGVLLAFAIEYVRTPRQPEQVEVPVRTLSSGPLSRDDLLVVGGQSRPASGPEYLLPGRPGQSPHMQPLQRPRSALQPPRDDNTR